MWYLPIIFLTLENAFEIKSKEKLEIRSGILFLISTEAQHSIDVSDTHHVFCPASANF